MDRPILHAQESIPYCEHIYTALKGEDGNRNSTLFYYLTSDPGPDERWDTRYKILWMVSYLSKQEITQTAC